VKIDWPTGSNVICIFVSHWNALQNGVFAHFRGDRNFSQIFAPWCITRENRSSGFGWNLINSMKINSIRFQSGSWINSIRLQPKPLELLPPRKKIYTKMPLEDEHVGYFPGENPHEVLTCHFGHVSFSGFESTAVQCCMLPIDKVHGLTTTVGTCDNNNNFQSLAINANSSA